MNRRGKSTKASTVDLRAFREQRSAELAASTDPIAEAKRREKSFLNNLSNALADYLWLVRNEGWRSLGFDSLGAWYTTRVEAPMRALGARPNPEVGIDMALRIHEEEMELPPAQRRSMADLATIAGVSERKLRRLVSRSAPAANDRVSDLGNPTVIDGEAVETNTAAGESSVVDDPADGVEAVHDPAVDTPASSGGEEVSPPEGVTPQDPPVAAASNDRSALVAQQPGPNASPDDADTSNPPEEPGDRYNSDEGDKSGEAAIPPAASPDLVHIDHPSATGEAPAGSEVPPRAGERPSDVGEASGDETAGAGLPAPGPASAVDPDQPIASPEELKKLIDEWLDVLDRRVEYALLAPQYDEDTLLDLELQVEGFARTVGLIRMWMEKS